MGVDLNNDMVQDLNDEQSSEVSVAPPLDRGTSEGRKHRYRPAVPQEPSKNIAWLWGMAMATFLLLAMALCRHPPRSWYGDSSGNPVNWEPADHHIQELQEKSVLKSAGLASGT